MTTAIIINNGIQQLAIQTVAPEISIGEIQVSADRRSTKETPVADDQRIRRIVLPANFWGELSANIDNSKSQGLTDVLREAIKKIANDKLKDVLAESPAARFINLNDYSISNLLSWSEETASSRGSITFTREQVEAWFEASVTKEALTAKWKDANEHSKIVPRMQFLKNRFAALAAKNHGLKDAADADKLLALMDEADTATAIGADIAGRIAHISKTLTAKANEATISMDDL